MTSPCPDIGPATLDNLHKRRWALIIAHPGHELLVHGWLERVQPLVMVLTNGSGSSGQDRVEASARVLQRAGASWTRPFGRFADKELYQAILNHDFALFCSLVEELAATLFHAQVDCVVGDAAEGFNPGHDVCRLVIDAAADLAQRRYRHRMANFDFALEGAKISRQDTCHSPALLVRLNPDELARKWAAADQYQELSGEVARLVGRLGPAAFASECLHRVRAFDMDFSEHAPFYEAYGRRKVAAGQYQQVLRYDRHVRPLAGALREFAKDDSPCLA